MPLVCQAPLPHAAPVAVVAGPLVVVARASLTVASPRGVAPGRPEESRADPRPPRCQGPAPGRPGDPRPHAGRIAASSLVSSAILGVKRREARRPTRRRRSPSRGLRGRSSEETLRDWETWASMPRHPLAKGTRGRCSPRTTRGSCPGKGPRRRGAAGPTCAGRRLPLR